MQTSDVLTLCALKSYPAQRIVHQAPSGPDRTGHSCFPESYFFREPRAAGKANVGAMTFRRLRRLGWITRVVADASEYPQDEYALSAAAEERFAVDHEWQQALFIHRRHVPPRRAA